MRLDFGHVDKSRTNEMLADIEAKINGNGLGIPEIYYRFPGLVQRLVGLLASCVLLTGLFNTAARYTESFVTSPAATVALIALVLLTMVLAFRLAEGNKSC